MKHIIYLALVAVLLYAPFLPAQKMVQFRLDPKTDFMFDEVGVLLHQDKDIVNVSQVLPENMRSKENKNVNLQEGDVIAIANGTRIKEVSGFRKLYDALKIGDELKLGIKREGQSMIISIHKSDPEKRGGPKMMKMTIDGKNSDALPGIGFVETSGNAVIVKEVFDRESASAKDFKQKDILRSLNGISLTSIKDLKNIYDKIPTGGKAEFSVSRDGKDITLDITKPEAEKIKLIQQNKP
jgi:S1-C subfamily serine protease